MKTINWVLILSAVATLIRGLNSTPLAHHEPCAVIRHLQEDWESRNNTSKPLQVDAKLAAQCLLSVPLNVTDDILKLEELGKYLKFQSTIDWAADPPPTGLYREPINITAGLEKIRGGLLKGEYHGTYQVAADIRKLLHRVRDGHLKWQSPCLEGAFQFEHDFPIVHLWDDDERGKIYAAEDLMDREMLRKGIIGRTSDNESPFSAISAINNEPALPYLLRYSDTEAGSFHDPDALWNSLFATRKDGRIATGGFTTSSLIPDPLYFTVEFENGTRRTIDWKATVVGNFSDIASGTDYYRKHCQIFEPRSNADISESSRNPDEDGREMYFDAMDRVPGYPLPLSKSFNNFLSSYIVLSSDNHLPVGVLAIHTFLAMQETTKFQDFVIDTLETFYRNNITNIIIDVTNNGGGNIALGYSTFAQFFPTVNPSATTNMRAHPGARILAHSAASIVEELISDASIPQELIDNAITSPFCHLAQESVDGRQFSDWRDAYGPVTVRGEQYTNYMRWDLAGPEFNLTSPVEGKRWNPEDIVIVGDGMCSSTCTLFVSAMAAAGVRTVTYGGRPQRGPMQIIGGVEGSQVLTFDDIWELSHEAMQRALAKQNRTVMQDPNSNDNPTITTAIKFDGSVEESFEEVDPDEPTVEQMLTHLPRRKLRGKGVINLRNAFDPGRDVPREFVYRASDYRLPIKREEWERIELLWRRVAQEVWHI